MAYVHILGSMLYVDVRIAVRIAVFAFKWNWISDRNWHPNLHQICR